MKRRKTWPEIRATITQELLRRGTVPISAPLQTSLDIRRARRQPKPDLERAHRGIVKARSGGRCEVAIIPIALPMIDGVFTVVRCRRTATDVHHLVKRSQGGRGLGPRQLVHVCRVHHDMTDAATTQTSTSGDGEVRYGRLRITATAHGFACWMEYDGKAER